MTSPSLPLSPGLCEWRECKRVRKGGVGPLHHSESDLPKSLADTEYRTNASIYYLNLLHYHYTSRSCPHTPFPRAACTRHATRSRPGDSLVLLRMEKTLMNCSPAASWRLKNGLKKNGDTVTQREREFSLMRSCSARVLYCVCEREHRR